MWTCPCAVCVPRGFGAELQLRRAGPSFPRACWQLSPRRGRLEPEPSVSKGFSCAQWLSPHYWARRVPRCWSRTLRVGSRLVPPCKCAPPILHTSTFAPEGGRAGGRHAGTAPGAGGRACGAALAHHQSPRPCSSGPSGLPAPSRYVCVPLCVCVCVCMCVFIIGYLKQQANTHS